MISSRDHELTVNVYDFDHTVYRGDCSLDFYFYCLSTEPRLLKYLPRQCWHGLLFLMKLEKRTTFKGHFFSFVLSLHDTIRKAEQFWEGGASKKLAPWYRTLDHSSDVIISASPQFLLMPVCGQLGVPTLIATTVDPRTGAINGVNCRGLEKVRRFRAQFPDAQVGKAYGDSQSDMPVLRLAREPYIVIRHTVVPLGQYVEMSKAKRLSTRLFSRA